MAKLELSLKNMNIAKGVLELAIKFMKDKRIDEEVRNEYKGKMKELLDRH